MGQEQKATRRRYSAQFKAQVLAECAEPRASVAKVAMAHGINDNVVHSWRKRAREASPAAVIKPSEFVPVRLTAAPAGGVDARGIEVELHRGAVTMRISWPLSAAAAEFAAWTRELLR